MCAINGIEEAQKLFEQVLVTRSGILTESVKLIKEQRLDQQFIRIEFIVQNYCQFIAQPTNFALTGQTHKAGTLAGVEHQKSDSGRQVQILVETEVLLIMSNCLAVMFSKGIN